MRTAPLGMTETPTLRGSALQSRLLKRTVLDAAAHTALYLAAGLFPLSLKNGADPSEPSL